VPPPDASLGDPFPISQFFSPALFCRSPSTFSFFFFFLKKKILVTSHTSEDLPERAPQVRRFKPFPLSPPDAKIFSHPQCLGQGYRDNQKSPPVFLLLIRPYPFCSIGFHQQSTGTSCPFFNFCNSHEKFQGWVCVTTGCSFCRGFAKTI